MGRGTGVRRCRAQLGAARWCLCCLAAIAALAPAGAPCNRSAARRPPTSFLGPRGARSCRPRRPGEPSLGLPGAQREPRGLRRSSSSQGAGPSEALKAELFEAISHFNKVQERDGKEAVDFGVKGGELNKDTRAPRNLAEGGGFYKISQDLGVAADEVFRVVDLLAQEESLASEATRSLGSAQGASCPLHGEWRLLFTTAADATFSRNSSRGDATASNVVDGVAGTVTNVIDFAPGDDGRPPALEQLRVRIAATALSERRVGLEFKYVKALVTRFFGLPLPGGRRATLTLPVPAPFITRVISFFTRKEPPKAFFEVLYLDEHLRIHRTGEGNIFIQKKAAAPLICEGKVGSAVVARSAV